MENVEKAIEATGTMDAQRNIQMLRISFGLERWVAMPLRGISPRKPGRPFFETGYAILM
jgi:hypothetical protein